MTATKIETLLHIEDIKRVKARYCRFLDGKRWELLPSLFTVDARFEGFAAAPKGSDVLTFVAGLTRRMKDAVTFHQVLMADIVFLDPGLARVIWSMTDYVEWPTAIGLPREPAAVGFRGYGYYEEEYRLTAGGWRIGFMRLARHRLDPVNRGDQSAPFGGVSLPPELMKPSTDWLEIANAHGE